MSRLLRMAGKLPCAGTLFLACATSLMAGADGAVQQGCLLRKWPQNGPPMVWRTDLLEHGFSPPVVLDGVVYVTGGREEGSLFAFNMDGRLLWRRAYGREFGSGAYAGPRSVPIVERDITIVTSAFGDVHALRTDSQAGLWSFNVFVRYGGRRPAGGCCATPVRYGDTVILACGGVDDRTPSVVAVNRLTGDTVWTAASLPGDFGIGDGGPSLVRYNGGELLIAPFYRGVLALDPASGRRAWGWSTVGGGPSARPVCAEGLIYLPTLGGRLTGTPGLPPRKGGVMLRVTEGGGYLELWKGPPASPGQVVIADGRLFTGDACYDAVLGRVSGRVPGLGGVISCADGLLYYLQDGPTLSLVDPTMGSMRLAGRFRPDGIGDRDLWVPPVIGEGRLFLRDRNRMSVYDLRSEPESVGPRLGGSGRYPGAPPPIRWLPPQNLLWRRSLPVTGLSAPVVHRGHVLMAGEPGAVVCCDAETGAVEWFRDLTPKAGRAQRGPSAGACEPVVSGDRAWARFSDGTVLCLGLDGTTVWSTAIAPSSNSTLSAVLSDGIVVLGGGDVVGLDAATGAERWRLRSQGQEIDVAGKAWICDRGVVITSAGHLIRSLDGTVIVRDLPAAKAGCVAVERATVYAAVGTARGYAMEAYRLPPRAERGMPVRSLWKAEERGMGPVSLTAAGGRVHLATEDGVLHVHDGVNGVKLRSVEAIGNRLSPVGDRQLWAVGDRLYAGVAGGTGTVQVCRADTGEPLWSFSTAEPLVGMAFDGGRQFVRAGSVLHCIGGVSPSRGACPALVEPPTDSWLRLRGRRPITRVAPGEMPRFWLYCGPFVWQRGTDPLQPLGGVASARPAPGEDAADGRRSRRFALLQERTGQVSISESDGSRVMDFTGATDGVALPCAYYLFTTIENLSARWFVYSTSVSGGHRHNDGALRVRSWLGGKEVVSGDYVRLAAGRTALMVEVVVEAGAVEGTTLTLAPGFLELEQQAVDSAHARDASWKEYEAKASCEFVLQ